MITQIQKRDSSVTDFNPEKITDAIEKAMLEVGHGDRYKAEGITKAVVKDLEAEKLKDERYIPTVESVQDIVEDELMNSEFHDVAKAYILYRNKQAEARKRDIFSKRTNLKPYEYPELLEYSDAIRHSYWLHTEFNFTGDIHQFKVQLNDIERNAIKNTMLAISQIEVAVKTFWGDVYHRLPKPEVGSVGSTFAESEVRHHDAYSHLLELLGLNDEFEKIMDIPVLKDRVQYLEAALKNSKSDRNQDYAEAMLLFSLFIEHVSLFSQFLIIMSFNKYRNELKGISNVVEATSKEEQIHGNFGISIIKIIKEENPHWFDAEHSKMVQELCQKAYESESDIIDWIFEQGELDFMPKAVVKSFIQDRFNRSLKSLDIEPIFDVDPSHLKETEWFDDEILTTKHNDFFDKRPINYSKKNISITSDDLF